MVLWCQEHGTPDDLIFWWLALPATTKYFFFLTAALTHMHALELQQVMELPFWKPWYGMEWKKASVFFAMLAKKETFIRPRAPAIMVIWPCCLTKLSLVIIPSRLIFFSCMHAPSFSSCSATAVLFYLLLSLVSIADFAGRKGTVGFVLVMSVWLVSVLVINVCF